MATVCTSRATGTSARVSTSYTVGGSTRNLVYTLPARTTFVPYTTTGCTTRSATPVCSTVRSSRASVIPAQVTTTTIFVHIQRTIYITNFVTLYSTSCSISRRPTTTTTPPPVTTYITLGTTTTQTSIIYPSLSTADGPTDTPEPIVDGVGTAAARKVPVGAIVGGVLGGLVAVALLGLLIYFLLFKKAKGQGHQDDSQHLQHSRPLSGINGQSSPSEASSGAFYPQMQEYGAQYANVHGRQGHQYTHVRQDSMAGIGVAMGGGQFQGSPPSSPHLGPEQGQYYRQSGHYLGHAEVQDSRF